MPNTNSIYFLIIVSLSTITLSSGLPVMITCTGGPESILEVLSGQTTSIEMLFDCGQPVQGISRSSYIVDSTRRWLPIRWELQSNISDVKINGSQIRLGVQLKAKMGSFGYYEMLAMLFSEEDDNTDYYARFNVSVVPEKGVGEAKFDDGLWSQWFYNPVSGDRTFNFNASAASAPDRLLSKPMNLKLACQDILLTDRFGATIPDTHCRWLQSRFTQKSFYNGTHHVTTGTITLKPEDVAPGSPLDQINPCFALTDDFHEYEYSPQWNIGGDSRSGSNEQTFCFGLILENPGGPIPSFSATFALPLMAFLVSALSLLL